MKAKTAQAEALGLVQIGAAAARWHRANQARRAAGREHRIAKEAEEGCGFFDAAGMRAREAEGVADKAHAEAKRRERATRRALERLCAQRAGATDADTLHARTVDAEPLLEVQP